MLGKRSSTHIAAAGAPSAAPAFQAHCGAPLPDVGQCCAIVQMQHAVRAARGLPLWWQGGGLDGVLQQPHAARLAAPPFAWFWPGFQGEEPV